MLTTTGAGRDDVSDSDAGGVAADTVTGTGAGTATGTGVGTGTLAMGKAFTGPPADAPAVGDGFLTAAAAAVVAWAAGGDLAADLGLAGAGAGAGAGDGECAAAGSLLAGADLTSAAGSVSGMGRGAPSSTGRIIGNCDRSKTEPGPVLPPKAEVFRRHFATHSRTRAGLAP
jgi:hypothetical protein